MFLLVPAYPGCPGSKAVKRSLLSLYISGLLLLRSVEWNVEVNCVIPGIRDVEHVKEVVQTCWEQIGQDVIDRAIGQFRKRLSLVVATGGGHIEHRFD